MNFGHWGNNKFHRWIQSTMINSYKREIFFVQQFLIRIKQQMKSLSICNIGRKFQHHFIIQDRAFYLYSGKARRSTRSILG